MSNMFHTTMQELERSLTCSLIASDLNNGIKAWSRPDTDLVSYAIANRFSRVPLKDEGSPRQATVTHVAIVDLDNESLINRRPLAVDDLIAGDTPIGAAIQILNNRGFCFVLVQHSICKILTRSDFNKPPVRVYLSACLAHLEGLLTDTITYMYPDDTWTKYLTDKRVKEAHALLDKKRVDDFDTTLIDCTTLSDKATIVGKAMDIRQKLSLKSRNESDSQFKRINGLRNRLYHNLPPLTDEADQLRNHLYHNQQLVKTKDLSWLATTVDHLQTWIACLAPTSEDTAQEEPQHAT